MFPESCSVMSNSLWHHGLYSPWNSPGQNTGVGSLSLLQRIFPTQGSNPGLPHYRRILYQLSHKVSPKNTGVGSLSLLQWIFATQKSNWGLRHCRQILYQLNSHFSSVQSLSRIQLFATPWTAVARLPCPSPTPRADLNSHPQSRWFHPTISSSVIPFSSCLQSFPASGSFVRWRFHLNNNTIKLSTKQLKPLVWERAWL